MLMTSSNSFYSRSFWVYLDMNCVGVGNHIENAKYDCENQAKVSIFTHQKFISSKIVAHILFQVKDVFSKDLEPMVANIL